MDVCHLYKLPKDLLVKLLTTIERDTIIRIEKKYETVEEELDIYEALSRDVEVYVCIEPDCISLRGFNGLSLIHI